MAQVYGELWKLKFHQRCEMLGRKGPSQAALG